MLRAGLHYGYGDFEVPAEKSVERVSIETVPDTWDLVRIHCQPEREQYFYQLLTDPNYRLKRAGSDQPFGVFELRARVHPVDLLMRAVQLLTEASFEIYGEENLKVGKVNRATPTVRVNITSGIDWVDLKAGGAGLNLTAADQVIHLEPLWKCRPVTALIASARRNRSSSIKSSLATRWKRRSCSSRKRNAPWSPA